MEFDAARGSEDDAAPLFETIRRRYEATGYTMPQLVTWNVAARSTHMPVTERDGSLFVSGSSPAIFEPLLQGEMNGPEDLVRAVVESPRYAPVRSCR